VGDTERNLGQYMEARVVLYGSPLFHHLEVLETTGNCKENY
jgi:hypothetical protein